MIEQEILHKERDQHQMQSSASQAGRQHLQTGTWRQVHWQVDYSPALPHLHNDWLDVLCARQKQEYYDSLRLHNCICYKHILW